MKCHAKKCMLPFAFMYEELCQNEAGDSRFGKSFNHWANMHIPKLVNIFSSEWLMTIYCLFVSCKWIPGCFGKLGTVWTATYLLPVQYPWNIAFPHNKF